MKQLNKLTMDEKIHLINSTLSELIPETDELFKAARYAVLGGGKRLRPLLTLTVAEMFGEGCEKALKCASAIEMIHAYSLIHDDLPCMDDDDFRRGKPTVHKQFGEAMAVLTGDYLLTRSFEVIASDQELSSETKISLIQLLTASSGGFGMIGGQVVDIKSEGLSLSLSTLNKIHQLKTGKMITASIVAGALIAGALQHELECLRTFGEKIGLAFQIIDDVIDVSHSEQKHGKENSSDVENNKTTYVTLLGVEAATAAAHDLLNSGIEALDGIRGDTGQLIAIAKTLIDRQT